jgi:hypothetical protein
VEKLLYWLVKWPWMVGILVFLGLTQVYLGPWYLSAWFVLGTSFLALSLTARARSWLVQDISLRHESVALKSLNVESSRRP